MRTPSRNFTQTQLQELEEVFKKFDVNGDGKISSSELGSIMGSLGQQPSEEELQKMIKEFDADGDGFINLKEFVELNTKGVDSDEVLENLKDAFSLYDIDGNGSISAEELHKVLESLGDECSIAECKKMISGVDNDGDGMIDFKEFKVMMMAGASLPLENMAASKMLIPSLAHFRPLTCAAAASYPALLVCHPPDLLKWVKREGGFVHKAVKIIQDTTYGQGIVASGEIPKGSDLIVLPDHVPLKFQSDKEDGAGSVLLHLSNQVPLVFKLVVIFSPNQVNNRCCFLLEFEQEVKNALKNLKPSEHPFGGQDVDASSLGWAGNVGGLIQGISFVVAEREIKQNDPLLLNYGCLSNDFFLLDYGFVILSNPYDYIEFKYDGALMDAASMAAGVSSPNFSSSAPWQQQVLSQLKLDGEAPNLKVIVGGSELVEGHLLAALRVLLSDDMESVQRYDLNVLKSLSAEAPLGVANEMAAFRTIIALCMIALGHFPLKMMDDESLLKQDVSISTELVIQFRMQKKSVIIDVM
ncbi:hypothetical protein CRYUN_Cryun29cG0073900 [Craigia yunnanensis]